MVDVIIHTTISKWCRLQRVTTTQYVVMYVYMLITTVQQVTKQLDQSTLHVPTTADDDFPTGVAHNL